MNNIYDYIKYYKNASFDEVNFNVMDALIYSMLIYLPLETIEDGSTLIECSEMLKDIECEAGSIKEHAIQILNKICNSTRYKNIKLFNIVKKENEEIQFGAMTVRDEKYTFVAFEGTNGSMIGWKENFNLSCNYPCITQNVAIQYLMDTIKIQDKRIYVGGHSKGGNLAMTSAMECDKKIFNKIKNVYNFDGPGFRVEQFKSEKFEKMSKKLRNILPDGSLVGILLNNKNYEYVKSNGFGSEKHDPINWHVFGEFFIENNLSESSKGIHDSINKSIEKLNDKDMEKFINIIYDFLVANDINNIADLQKLKMNDYKNLLEKAKGVDENTKKLFFDVTRILINPSTNT